MRVETIRDRVGIVAPRAASAGGNAFGAAARNDGQFFETAAARRWRFAVGQRIAVEPGAGTDDFNSRRFVRERGRSGASESAAPSLALVTSIGRKHRRVEAALPPSMRAGRAVLVSAREPEGSVAIRNTGSARRHVFEESEPLHRMQRPNEVPFDATRMTDEVLKQLDRRLVAAKERRGRN